VTSSLARQFRSISARSSSIGTTLSVKLNGGSRRIRLKSANGQKYHGPWRAAKNGSFVQMPSAGWPTTRVWPISSTSLHGIRPERWVSSPYGAIVSSGTFPVWNRFGRPVSKTARQNTAARPHTTRIAIEEEAAAAMPATSAKASSPTRASLAFRAGISTATRPSCVCRIRASGTTIPCRSRRAGSVVFAA
jgi:hypothetical protein